jgi:translation elongation factor EF-1alpha
MKHNIVVFGPAESGKSTLIGYLTFKQTPNFDLDAFTRQLQNELDQHYDPKQRLAYIVDKARDERLPHVRPQAKGKKRVGTSMYLHTQYLEWDHGETPGVTVIDTPGSEHSSRTRLRGQYWGDIGVFMVEIEKLLFSRYDPSTIDKFLAPLFAWQYLKGKSDTCVIVLSKCDRIGFERAKITQAIQEIQRLLSQRGGDAGQQHKATCVPISINVDTATDHNVTARPDSMSWMSPQPLLDTLKTLWRQSPKKQTVGAIVFHVSRMYEYGHPNPVFEGKLLQGGIRLKDSVLIAPMLLDNKDYVVARAEVEELRHINQETSLDHLNEGEIGTVKVRTLTVGDYKVKKQELDELKTTCLFSRREVLLLGWLLRFRVRQLDKSVIIHLGEHVGLLWFGRKIAAKVVHVYSIGDNDEIVVQMLGDPVAIPENGANLSFANFLLMARDKDFVNVQFLECGRFESLKFFWKDKFKAELYLQHLEWRWDKDGILLMRGKGAEADVLDPLLHKLGRLKESLVGTPELAGQDYFVSLERVRL